MLGQLFGGLHRRPPLSAPVLLLAALLASPSAAADAQHERVPEPAAYALEDVTLVRADGTRQRGVTLVVRDGLVAALGPDVEAPDDARLLEGDSLRVYPGLVDAEGGTGLTWPGEEEGRGDGGGGDGEETAPWNPDRATQGFTPRRRAVEALDATGEDLESVREAGVVASAVHPDDGLAPGRGVLLLHRPGAPTSRELVVRPELGPVLAFDAAEQAYPSTHFGVVAFLRQRFLDADRRQGVLAAHRESAAGMGVPDWDPDLAVLSRAASGDPRVFFRASRAEDVRQALDLADAHGFRPVIVGGREAWRVADRLARRDVPVLVSLDFPEPQRWDPDAGQEESGDAPGDAASPPGEAGDSARAAAAGDAAADRPRQEELAPEVLREKRRIEDAWSNAGRLAEAGVRVALTSGGGEADLREGARKAIEYGLPEDAALRAVTAAPAEILGAPWLARIGEGYPANLVVTDGPLFGEEAPVRYVFVEGSLQRGVEPGAEPEEPPAVEVSGRWEAEIETGSGTFTGTFSLEQSGASFSGTMSNQFGRSRVVNGVVSGNEVSFTVEVDAGGETLRLSFSGTASGGEMSGSGSGPPEVGSFTWEATRQGGGPGGGTGR